MHQVPIKAFMFHSKKDENLVNYFLSIIFNYLIMNVNEEKPGTTNQSLQ